MFLGSSCCNIAENSTFARPLDFACRLNPSFHAFAEACATETLGAYRYLTEWLESRSRMLELFYLPSYSPELNPDEYLNRDLKARLAEQNLPTSKDALRQSVEMHMRKRQSAPDSIKKFFEKDEVRYASEDY